MKTSRNNSREQVLALLLGVSIAATALYCRALAADRPSEDVYLAEKSSTTPNGSESLFAEKSSTRSEVDSKRLSGLGAMKAADDLA